MLMSKIKSNIAVKINTPDIKLSPEKLPQEDDDPIGNAWKKGTKTATFGKVKVQEVEENNSGSSMLMSKIKSNLAVKNNTPDIKLSPEKMPQEDDDPIGNAWKKGTKTATFGKKSNPDEEDNSGSSMLMSQIKSNLAVKNNTPDI